MTMTYIEDEGHLRSAVGNGKPRRCRSQVALRCALVALVIASFYCEPVVDLLHRHDHVDRRRADHDHHHHHDHGMVQGRGELWLRCPTSTTWYNYASGAGEWHPVATSDSGWVTARVAAGTR